MIFLARAGRVAFVALLLCGARCGQQAQNQQKAGYY